MFPELLVLSKAQYAFTKTKVRVIWGECALKVGSSLTNLSLSVSSGSYCPSAIVGPRVYGNTLVTLFIIPLCGQ